MSGELDRFLKRVSEGGDSMPFHSDIQPHLVDGKAYVAGLALVLFLMGRNLKRVRWTVK